MPLQCAPSGTFRFIMVRRGIPFSTIWRATLVATSAASDQLCASGGCSQSMYNDTASAGKPVNAASMAAAQVPL